MNRLKQLRIEKGWTQKYLGRLLNVRGSAVSKYETGQAALTESTIKNLSNIFNVSTDFLLGLSQDRVRCFSVHKPSLAVNPKENLHITSIEDTKILSYYKRLNTENQEYIKGQMIALYREQQKSKNIETVYSKESNSDYKKLDDDTLKELESYRSELINKKNIENQNTKGNAK